MRAEAADFFFFESAVSAFFSVQAFSKTRRDCTKEWGVNLNSQ
jgi:hypothetical protein